MCVEVPLVDVPYVRSSVCLSTSCVYEIAQFVSLVRPRIRLTKNSKNFFRVCLRASGREAGWLLFMHRILKSKTRAQY
jgi:hypothetical protein